MSSNDKRKIIRRVLDTYVGSALNIDSEAARQIVTDHIARELEYHEGKDEFWEEINEDI